MSALIHGQYNAESARNAAIATVGGMAETVKEIENSVKKLGSNRRSLETLVSLCRTQQYGLYAIVEETRSWDTPAKAKVWLDNLSSDLLPLTNQGFWSRISNRNDIPKVIQNAMPMLGHRQEVLLQMMVGAISSQQQSTTERLSRQHQAIFEEMTKQHQITIQEIRHLMDNRESSNRTIRDVLPEEDAAEARNMQRIRGTIEQLTAQDVSFSPGNADHDMLHSNVMANTAGVLRSLQNPSAGESPEMREAREGLMKAIQQRGSKPIFTIDSSELTAPVEHCWGSHAVILRGIRNGEYVAIKVSV
ncbi:hypothetical protein DL93DRAFT_91401 [Clavulina sp. PMI_390]|nr:hypothetical protein DL93DRAFT_91401 [Clavulina sp. PMI_390]